MLGIGYNMLWDVPKGKYRPLSRRRPPKGLIKRERRRTRMQKMSRRRNRQ